MASCGALRKLANDAYDAIRQYVDNLSGTWISFNSTELHGAEETSNVNC